MVFHFLTTFFRPCQKSILRVHVWIDAASHKVSLYCAWPPARWRQRSRALLRNVCVFFPRLLLTLSNPYSGKKKTHGCIVVILYRKPDEAFLFSSVGEKGYKSRQVKDNNVVNRVWSWEGESPPCFSQQAVEHAWTLTHQDCCVQEFQMGPLGAVGPVPTVTGERKKKEERIHSGQLNVTFDSPSGLTTFPSSYVKSQLCPRCPLLPCCCPFCQTCVTLSRRALASGLIVFLFHLVYFLSAEKENPYEDVDLKRKSLGRKLEANRSWTAMDKKQSSPPQVSSSLRSSTFLPLNQGECWLDKRTVPFVFLSVGGTGSHVNCSSRLQHKPYTLST